MPDPKIPGGGVLKSTATAAADLKTIDATLKSILKTLNAVGPASQSFAANMSKASTGGSGTGGTGASSKGLMGMASGAAAGATSGLSNTQRTGLALGLASVAGAISMIPSTKTGVGMQQSLFYGGMASGNVSTGNLNRMSSSAQQSLGNFQTSVGGAQAASSTLSQYGFSSTSAAGKNMLGQVGAMSLTTGMSNQAVAGVLGSQMTNPGQSNMLRMLGIETYGANGQIKDVAKIAQQMLQKVFPGRKITPELVQTALRPGGTLSMMLAAYFPDPQMQTLVKDAMMKTAMNGGQYTPNNAATMQKLGLSNTSSNPQAAQMGYLSSESRKANVVRNGQVTGYSAGLGAGAATNDALTGMADAIQPVTDNLIALAAALDTFTSSTSGGAAIRNIAGVGLTALGSGSGGGSDSLGTANVASSGASTAGKVAWPTGSASIGTKYGVAGKMWKSGRHTGVDFNASDGTPIAAFEDGVVKSVGSGGSYGNNVVIDHGGGIDSLYAHLSSSKVRVGDKVTAGQNIGASGHTGNVTGPHLHFEIRKNGGYGHDVDPMPYLSGAIKPDPSQATSQGGTDAGSSSVTSQSKTKKAEPVLANSGGGGSSPSGVNIWTDISGLHATASNLLSGLGGGGGGTSLGQGETNVAGGSSTSGASDGTGASAGASGTKPTMTADSGRLSTLVKAGWRGDALKTAWEVMMAESGGNAGSHNPDARTGDNSYGLFQINMLGDMGPSRRKQYGLSSNDDLYNPDTNAKVAFQMSAQGKDWTPWSTYKNGAYRRYSGQWDELVKKSGLKGYSQGAYRVPKDQAANIHSDEMILTASVATAVRENMAKGRAGQSGGAAPKVEINMYVNDVSDAAARAFASKIKGYLEDDRMYAELSGVTA